MNLTTEEWRLVNDNSTKLVRRVVNPDQITPLGELVFKLAAQATGIEKFTPLQWDLLMEQLETTEAKLASWVDAKLAEIG